MNKWDIRFLELAEHVSTWSKDPSTKVGAVLVSPDRRTIFHGYNGFPQGMSDDELIYDSRDQKYDRIVHAEMNAVLNATAPVRGFTCYTFPLPVCSRCCIHLIQSGISRIVVPAHVTNVDRWKDSFERAVDYCREAGVQLDIISLFNRKPTQPEYTAYRDRSSEAGH